MEGKLLMVTVPDTGTGLPEPFETSNEEGKFPTSTEPLTGWVAGKLLTETEPVTPTVPETGWVAGKLLTATVPLTFWEAGQFVTATFSAGPGLVPGASL